MTRRVDMLVVHCSATDEAADIGVAEIRPWHTSPPKNWSDIGYHYVIRRDGRLEEGRSEFTPGAHAHGFNEHSLGICLAGGVDADDKTKAEFNYTRSQMATLEDLLSKLSVKYPNAKVLGHRDLPGVTKQCPCFDVRAWWYGTNKPALLA